VSRVPFEEMPDGARVWVFAAVEPLGDEAAEALLREVDAFLDGWLAHGRTVIGARDWRDGRFLIVAADEAASGVSGCSIDALFRTLQGIEPRIGTSLTDRSRVWWRSEGGGVRAGTRAEFRERASAGEVSADTTVFDTTVATVGGVRSGAWERPARESWHARILQTA
jgi:hypothetical protein